VAAPGVYAVTPSTPGIAPYVVRQSGTHWTCDCPAWRYSKASPQACKHIAAVRAAVCAVPSPADACATLGHDWQPMPARERRLPVGYAADRCSRCGAVIVRKAAVPVSFDENAERARLVLLGARVDRDTFGF
jgi:hypothetical protein